MEIAPKNQDPILLSQSEIDVKFNELDIMTYFKNTCKPRTVKSTDVKEQVPISSKKKRAPWEFVEYRSKSDNSRQGKLKVRKTVIEGEEEFHVLWFRDATGQIYVVDIIDAALLLGL